jgi:hypothetical protein
MNIPFFILAVVALALAPVVCAGAESAAATPATPARSAVDPAMEAAHTQEDVKRHRTMAAAHEAAAKCQESGKGEDLCMAELAKACKGIAYGKYCGMKHPD